MPSRRRVLRSLAVVGGGSIAGCSTGFGQQRFEDGCSQNTITQGDLDLSSAVGSWPQYQSDPANTGAHPEARGVPDEPEVAWRYATCDPMWEASPTVADGSVYVSNSQQPSVYALDAESGAVEWSVESGGSETAPAVVDDTVYVAGRDVLALDADDGSERWRFATKEQYAVESSPAVVDGVVYVAGGANDPTLYALDADDGSEIWSVPVGGDDLHRSSPAVAEGTAFVVDEEGTLFALDASTGDERWSKTGTDFYASPAVRDGRVYAITSEDELVALTLAGDVEWRTSAPSSSNPPVVTSDRVYVAGGTKLTAHDVRDGSLEWAGADDQRFGTPVVAGDTMYVGQEGHDTDDGPAGAVLGLDASSGLTRWRLVTRGIPAGEGGPYAGTLGSPAVVDGALYVCTGAGDVLAIGSG